MYIDTQLELSDSQAVTVSAISANVVDLLTTGAAGANPLYTTANTFQDIGQSNEPLYLVVFTNVACTDTGNDATLTITLESDSVVTLATSPTVHFSSGALPFAAFSPAGTRLVTVALPQGVYERYLGLRYTVASGPLITGAFDAFLTTDPAGANRIYKSGFVVN
jgi:hypothetical protein